MVNDLIFRWILDVAFLWPSSENNVKRELTHHRWAHVETSQEALNLLSSTEREKVLRFYFASDAKLCLGSCLLKRKAVSTTCGIPWSDVVIGQDSNRKPCFKPDQYSGRGLEFNVSHHGSLVALVGCEGKNVQLGVDVVKIDFERDYSQVKEKGFSDWASTYESVFSDREMEDIVRFMAEPTAAERTSPDVVRAQLRNFYAHWCLKEAFVKMTGEALLASWLTELEFRDVRAPDSSAKPENGESCWGEISRGFTVWLRGKQMTDISMEIQAYQDDYMIATAASVPLARFAAFEKLDFQRGILPR